MSNFELVEETELKEGGKITKIMNKKLLKNQKGFSLVELLIVIAILGVLAVISFNMFGGVLQNSKKRADDQQALRIAEALQTYCIDSGDWGLTKAYTKSDLSVEAKLSEKTPSQIIQILMDPVYNSGKSEFGPYYSKKDPEKAANVAPNDTAYAPQWNTAAGGGYKGWKITVYPKNQSVKCEPSKDDEAVVTISATY